MLIHGLTIPSIAYAALVPILVGAGYRVLLYDLYGRGYSDAPEGVPYDAKLYVTQLALLLQHLKWDRARIVGFSMGGAVAAAFVAAFPELAERDVVLVASAGSSDVCPITPLGYNSNPHRLRYASRNTAARLSSENS